MDKKPPMEAVFAHYFEAHYTKLWRLAQRILARHTGRADPERAHEAVQETFLIAWEKPTEFLGSLSPVGWLVNTLKNVLRNMVREDARWHARLQDVQDSLDRAAVHPAPGADLELEGLLPPEELDLLKRLYLHGETYAEVCAELGLKKSTLAMRVKRSKEAFQKKYWESEAFFAPACEQCAPAEHDRSRSGSQLGREEVLDDEGST